MAKITVDQADLSSALQILDKVAPSKPSIDILRFVKIEAEDGTLKLTATDLGHHLRKTLECETTGRICACVPAKAFFKLVKPMNGSTEKIVIQDEDTVDDDTRPEHLTLKVDGLSINLKTHDSEESDYPNLQPLTNKPMVKWDTEELKGPLQYILPTICQDETRPHINCAAIYNRVIASTDGHRLHRAPLPKAISTKNTKVEKPLLIPHNTAKILNLLLTGKHEVFLRSKVKTKKYKDHSGEVPIDTKEKIYETGQIDVNGWTLQWKAIETDFPPINQVIPSSAAQDITVDIDTKIFKTALKRASSLAGARESKRIVLLINSKLSISAFDDEVRDASIILEPEIQKPPTTTELRIGFLAPYIIEAISNSEKVSLSTSGPLDPIRIDLDDLRLAVVMPQRI